jgi:hypothetical protein
MPRMSRFRCGTALTELLVALVLAALLSAAAAAALTTAERHVRRAVAASEDTRALREADQVLTAEIRAAAVDSVQTRGDTAVEFPGLVGTSVVCVVRAGTLVLPPARVSSGLPYSVWRSVPEPGDLVIAFDTLTGGHWRSAVIDSVEAPTAGAGCYPSSGLLTAADSASRSPVLQLWLDRTVAGPGAGAPVRVLRRSRYVLLRGTNREWTLSYRRCDVTGSCGASQPVAGPLASASDSGLVFLVARPDQRIEATIRSLPRESGLPSPRRLLIGLRNRATASP